MSYAYDQETGVLSDGVNSMTINPAVDQAMNSYLATPLHLSRLELEGSVDWLTRTVAMPWIDPPFPSVFTAVRTDVIGDIGHLEVVGKAALPRLETNHIVPVLAGNATLTNMPAADTELPGPNYRVVMDLATCQEFRVTLCVGVVGFNGADIRFQGSVDNVTFGNLDGLNGPEILLNALGVADTGWMSLALPYRSDSVYIRMMGKDGNGAADPQIRQVLLHFR